MANVKQKAILSAVWSGLGLQGRKIRELMDGAAPAVPVGPSPGDDTRGAKGLLAKMGLAPKSRRGEPSGAASGAPEITEEELRALHKKRALFGTQMVRNMPAAPRAASYVPGTSSAAAPPALIGAAGPSSAAAAATARGARRGCRPWPGWFSRCKQRRYIVPAAIWPYPSISVGFTHQISSEISLKELCKRLCGGGGRRPSCGGVARSGIPSAAAAAPRPSNRRGSGRAVVRYPES